MYRKHQRLYPRLAAAAALALCASVAIADDSSMSVLTGDSYAFFNDLDYHPGKFNTARAKVTPDRDTAMKMPQKPRDAAAPPIRLADRPRVSLPSPFRDDKGA
jgi:hypothetical protein